MLRLFSKALILPLDVTSERVISSDHSGNIPHPENNRSFARGSLAMALPEMNWPVEERSGSLLGDRCFRAILPPQCAAQL
jgi:hypothetical protein